MTRARKARLLPALIAASAALAAAPGCGTQPRGVATDGRSAPTSASHARQSGEFVRTSAPQPGKPDLTRLTFDPSTRTLTLYELSDRSARWMLATPAAPAGVPVDREYMFPPEVDLDLDQITVFYTVPNRRPSPAVSLREIIDTREARVHR
jgi:hypothetical protein